MKAIFAFEIYYLANNYTLAECKKPTGKPLLNYLKSIWLNLTFEVESFLLFYSVYFKNQLDEMRKPSVYAINQT